MKTAAALTAVILSAALVAIACGGGENENISPLERYFRDVAALNSEAIDGSSEIGGRLREQLQDADSPDETLDALRDNAESTAKLTERHVDDLRDIDPPLEVEAEHRSWVEAHVDVLARVNSTLDAADEFDSPLEAVPFLLTALSDPENDLLSAAIDDACLALQDAAGAQGVEVDLLCVSPEDSPEDTPEE